MTATDKQQNLLIHGIGLITAVIAVMAFIENKRHQEFQRELFALDSQIKELELILKKEEVKKKGLA